MSLVLPAPRTVELPVKGTDDGFPVHRIYCVGRNYVEHAIEMGHSGREAPFFFMKPADAVLPVAEGETARLAYPSLTKNLHHEVELVVAIGRGGRDIPAAQAEDHIWGYAVGLDMTRRDLQGEAKKTGRPWDMGKGFDHSAPISALIPLAEAGDLDALDIALEVNGETRQQGALADLIWNASEILHELSKLYALRAGDLVFMGTPAGVAPLHPGDRFRARLGAIATLEGEVVAAPPAA